MASNSIVDSSSPYKVDSAISVRKARMSDDLEAQQTPSRVVVEQIHEQPKRTTAWGKIRSAIREPMAEFIGTALLVIFGAGSACSVVLSTNRDVASSNKGDFLSINFGWAIGIAMGVWVSGGISGGHINPAVTLTMAVWRGFPWKKVPAYIGAQILGGLVGAAIIYGSYFHAIDIFEGPGVRTEATAGFFATYALPYMTPASCFFAEFLATAILSMMVLAMTDKRNMMPTTGLLPLGLFLLFMGFGVSLGMQTAYALNPARDFGPRLFLSMAGYGKEVYTYRNHYWIWCPIIAPIVGAQAGAALYDLFLFEEPTIFNRKSGY